MPACDSPPSPTLPVTYPAWIHSFIKPVWPVYKLELAALTLPCLCHFRVPRDDFSPAPCWCRETSWRCLRSTSPDIPFRLGSCCPPRLHTERDTMGHSPGARSRFPLLPFRLALLLPMWEALFCLKRQEVLLVQHLGCSPPPIYSVVRSHQSFLFP